MGIGSWIAGILGWAMFGPIGALIGFALGSLISSTRSIEDSNDNRSRSSRNSFLVSLLVLSTAVIKADGKFLKSELEYVKSFILRNFGQQAVNESLKIIQELYKKDINVYEVGAQISANMNYSQRLQLFHYLVELARADGNVCQAELDVLRSIASALRINNADFTSITSMFSSDIESAYKILEIDKSATDQEVKSAYKRMAMKHHPDKVATLGPDVQKAAEEKFKKIQKAYEDIKKERNIS